MFSPNKSQTGSTSNSISYGQQQAGKNDGGHHQGHIAKLMDSNQGGNVTVGRVDFGGFGGFGNEDKNKNLNINKNKGGNNEMPEILLWRPTKTRNGTDTYGHATLSTPKYHMSFWPNDDLSNLKLQARAIVPGCSVDAGLVYYDTFDNYLEAEKATKEIIDENGDTREEVEVVKWNQEVRYTITCARDEDIDRFYEEFLRRNAIDPATVTKARGKEMVERKQIPVTKKLSKSQYRFTPYFAMDYEPLDISILLEKPQNCTSFCFHLIELAKKNSPRVVISDASNLPADLRNFEAVVKKYYLADSNPSANQSDGCHIF